MTDAQFYTLLIWATLALLLVGYFIYSTRRTAVGSFRVVTNPAATEVEPASPVVVQTTKWLRRRAGWLLAIALVAVWPWLQELLYTMHLQYFNGDKEAAASQSTWLPLGNPLSKLTTTLLVVALGYGFMWLGMRLFQPTLHRWSKDDFKTSFHALPDQWQLVIFTAYWLGSLLFFGLCWLGASLIA